MKTIVNLNELHWELLPHPLQSSDLGRRLYYPFRDLKRMLRGKRSCSNAEAIDEIEAYFAAKDKSFYKKGIKIWRTATLSLLLLKKAMLMNSLGSLGNYLPTCYVFHYTGCLKYSLSLHIPQN